MAEVYKVWDKERATYLALKLLREDLARDRIFWRRFKREADNLRQLQHPNIVRFYGLEREGLLAFMLMDYVEGTSLQSEIFLLDGKCMELEKVQRVTRAVCSGLFYAHNQGLAHCDLKPGNVMLHDNGTVLLADFGIARLTDAATATMVGMGTPAYMAPEQVKGLDPVPQTDIYALGVVLYEMLTGGERPFTGERANTTGTMSAKVRWEQVNLDPPSPRKYNPDLSPALEAVVLRCLGKEPANRYQTPLDLLNALERAVGDSRPEVVEDPGPRRVPVVRAKPELEKGKPATSASKTPTQLEPEEVEPVDMPAQSWWQRYGGWVGVGGVLLLFAYLVFGVRGLIGKPTPEVVVETVFVDREEGTDSPSKTSSSGTLTMETIDSETATVAALLTEQAGGQASTPEANLSPEIPTATALPKEIVDDYGIEMVLVPTGDFEMGMDPNRAQSFCKQYYEPYVNRECQQAWYEDEGPVHTVTLEAFYIDRYEVTNKAYQECVEDGVCDRPAKISSYTRDDYYGSPDYDDYPVVYVTWEDAQTYCYWRGAHLPTEAEWEKAARGPENLVFPWGDTWENDRANFCDQSCPFDWANPGFDDGYADTAPVGSYPKGASPYGAMDMAGNVWEWVADLYDENYYRESPRENPLGPEDGSARVLRGGSWSLNPIGLRAAYRFRGAPLSSYYTGYEFGFRCAREAFP
jgi:formylglycine-generating enzyme required for sulfatase activity